jgi:hypothetical protein
MADHFTLVVLLAWAYGQDFALIRLFSGAVGNHDARGSFGFVFDAFNDHAVCQRTQFHEESPRFRNRGEQKPTQKSWHSLTCGAGAVSTQLQRVLMIRAFLAISRATVMKSPKSVPE